MRKTLALLALMALAVPACAQVSAAEIIRTAPDKAAEFGTAKVASTVEMDQTLPGPAGEMSVTTITESEGVFDFVAQQGRMTTNTRFESPGVAGGTQTGEMVIDGLILYQRFPCPTGALAATPWLKLDSQAITGLDPSRMPTSTDPTATLEMLKGAADDVEEVGAEEVRGVSTTHYRATVSLERALENLEEEARERVRALFPESEQTITSDVWIDDEGLLRRMTTDFDVSAAGSSSTISMTTELFDYGEPVEIEIPPDDRVRPVGSLQELASVLGACSPGPRPPVPAP